MKGMGRGRERRTEYAMADVVASASERMDESPSREVVAWEEQSAASEESADLCFLCDFEAREEAEVGGLKRGVSVYEWYSP